MKTKMTVNPLLSLILCVVLFATATLMVGCNDQSPPETTTDTSSVATVTFTFEAYDVNGTATAFQITTTKETVGEALQEKGLISGEKGQYGLYVTTVNGITLDYEKDGMYWGFYENGNYAVNGVDKTTINPAVTYSLKPAK